MSDFATQVAIGLSEGRALIESLMTDSCTITRAGTGRGPWNESEGDYDPPARVAVYSGKCRLQIASVMGDASESDAGDREVITQGAVLQLPVLTSGGVAIGDAAVIDTCVEDPSLEDREFTVKGRHGKSQATARRLRVEEATA